MLWAVRAPIDSPGYIIALFSFFMQWLKKETNCLSVMPLKQFLRYYSSLLFMSLGAYW
jgi:hypothetical protein